ncbi:exported protein of unknown function [Hyphomicrobium sp. MC1]|nr:exported protein of unknown function [Hyphomicrobium sp. MC1]
MKRFVQFLQAALACTILVALIFSIPVVMASTPIHLGISFAHPDRLLAGPQHADSTAAPLLP